MGSGSPFVRNLGWRCRRCRGGGAGSPFARGAGSGRRRGMMYYFMGHLKESCNVTTVFPQKTRDTYQHLEVLPDTIQTCEEVWQKPRTEYYKGTQRLPFHLKLCSTQ